MKKIILSSLFFFTIFVAVAQSQTTTTTNQNNRYYVLVKYNVELVSNQNTYRLHEIKTSGEVREGDEKTEAWSNWKVLFRTQGEIKGTNFELTTEPETGILNFGRTEDTKILTRKNNGITGTTYGEYKQISCTKNIFTNYISTKHDIATNEGFNKDVECKEILSTTGEGSGTIKLAPTESYDIQMRLNLKNRRVEIRNWLPEAELSMQGLQGGSSSGDEGCPKNTVPAADVSEFVTQYTLGLNELIKNSILYNSKEGIDQNGREIPYKDITNLGEFMAFRLTNALLEETAFAQTGNRYVYTITLRDNFNDPVVNHPNNPDGSYYKKEFEGKQFGIRASIMIAFQKKEPTFDEYPGGELPPETDEPRLPWVPLMDKDDYPPDWFGNNADTTQKNTKSRNISVKAINENTNKPIGYTTAKVKKNGIEVAHQESTANGENIFTAATIDGITDKTPTKLSFTVDNFLPLSINNISSVGPDTTLVFKYKRKDVRGFYVNAFDINNKNLNKDKVFISDNNADDDFVGDANNVLYIAPESVIRLMEEGKSDKVGFYMNEEYNLEPVNNITVFGNDTTINLYPKDIVRYKVNGTVKTSNGAPVENKLVEILSSNISVSTNKQGKFTAYLPAGTHTLKVSGCQPEQQIITITNADVSVSFTKQ
ncbi:MAG: carboxypeptidase-like regulatory domain-containing protein [Chitinophagales bacterium]